MADYEMVPDNIPRTAKTRNKATTDAYAGYVTSKLSLGAASITLGIRHEDIEGEVLNYLDDSLRGQTQKLTAGSVSGIWQMTDSALYVPWGLRGIFTCWPRLRRRP